MQDRQDDNQRPKARVSSSTPSYPIPEVSSFVVILLGILVPVVVIVPVVVRECVSKKKRRRRVWGEGSWRVGVSGHGEWALTLSFPHHPLGRKRGAATETGWQTQVRTNPTGQNRERRQPLTQAFSLPPRSCSRTCLQSHLV